MLTACTIISVKSICVLTGFRAALRRPVERLYSRQSHRKWPRGLLPLQHGGSDQEGRWPPTSRSCDCVCACVYRRVCVCVLWHICESNSCSSSSWSSLYSKLQQHHQLRQAVRPSFLTCHSFPSVWYCSLLVDNTPPGFALLLNLCSFRHPPLLTPLTDLGGVTAKFDRS